MAFEACRNTSVKPSVCQLSLLRRATLVGTRSPYSLPFVILPVPARSPFRFIRHRRRSTPNLKEGAFWCALQAYILSLP